jgi:hypothetical protein
LKDAFARQEISPESFLNLSFRERAKERFFCGRLFYFISLFFRDASYIKMNKKNLVYNTDQIEFLEELGSQLSLDFLFSGIEKCSELETSLNQNRDPLLLFEEFWIRSKEILVS